MSNGRRKIQQPSGNHNARRAPLRAGMARLLLDPRQKPPIDIQEENPMAQTTEGSDSLAERVNELYWSGTMTVDDIVEDLGISRSSLYSTIEPVPAGLVCADCHERMVYTNRTMRDRGVAICPNCGRESEPGESAAAGETGSGFEESTPAGQEIGIDVTIGRLVETLRAVPAPRLALVGGGAALGIAAGAVATRLLHPQR